MEMFLESLQRLASGLRIRRKVYDMPVISIDNEELFTFIKSPTVWGFMVDSQIAVRLFGFAVENRKNST